MSLMSQFQGFPNRMQFTSVPNLFFTHLMPQIDDIAELKVSLYIFRLVYGKRGYPRFVTYRELAGKSSLMGSLSEMDVPPDAVLGRALEMAVDRGTILHLVLEKEGDREDIYFLNTESNKQVKSRIENGELDLLGMKTGWRAYSEVNTAPRPDIFTLYEENIGMLTPMIAEELKGAEGLYPESWIRDAIKEAVTYGKRKWSYISAILERWSAEGKDSGAHKRDSEKTGPDKYSRQKYGHMVEH